MFSKEATSCRRLIWYYYTSTMCVGFFWEPKNHAFRIGGVQFMKLLLESSRQELPLSLPDANNFQQRFCLTMSCSGSRTVRPFQDKKKQTAKNLDFLSTQKSQRFVVPKKIWGLLKKKHQQTFNNQAPSPKTYPKISRPRCYPTLTSASQPLHLCPTFEDVPQFSWGVRPRVVAHLLGKRWCWPAVLGELEPQGWITWTS